MLHLYASAEQRERFLEPLVAGDVYPVGRRSPSPRSRAATRRRCRRRAYLDGDEWVINGHKWFTYAARHAPRSRRCSPRPSPTPTKHMPVQLDHRADRHARLPDPARGADDGPRRRPALRGRLRQRPRAARRTCSATRGEGFLISQKRLGPGPHLPLHALARPGAAGVRADVRPRPHALRPRLDARREGRDPDDDRRVGGGDPGAPG